MLLPLLLLQAAHAAPAACPADSPLAQFAAGKPTASLPLGQPVELTVTAGTDPKRPGKVATAPFAAVNAGIYTFALGEGGWIDVVPAGGKALESIGHGRSACPGVRKLVAFRLVPGTYTFTATGLSGDAVKAALLAGDLTPKPPR